MTPLTMSKRESAVVMIFVGILCPAALFVFSWWASAALVIYGLLPLPEWSIAAAALGGLGAGLILDLLFLRRWASSFYSWDIKLLVPLYLFGSAVAVAWFMGFPLGNVIWGSLAGVYVGRRQYHQMTSPTAARQAIRRVGAFTAMVTALEALPIGLMALNEGIAVRTIQAVTGLDQQTIAGPLGVAMVIVLCIVLIGLQMGCTTAAARIAFSRSEAASQGTAPRPGGVE